MPRPSKQLSFAEQQHHLRSSQLSLRSHTHKPAQMVQSLSSGQTHPISKQTHLSLIKVHCNQRIASPLQTLPNQSLHRLPPRFVHQIGEETNLTPHRRLEERADICPPIACPHRDPEDCAQDFDDAVTWQVVSSGGDNAVGVYEAAGGFVTGVVWRAAFAALDASLEQVCAYGTAVKVEKIGDGAAVQQN